MIEALILDLGNVLAFHDNALRFARLAGGQPRGLDAEGIRSLVCGQLGVDLPMEERLVGKVNFTDAQTFQEQLRPLGLEGQGE